MSDVRVGMRLRPLPWIVNGEGTITVTALTERGFCYDLDAPRFIMPMLTQCQHGHEHYGRDGEAFYEPAGDPPPIPALPEWEEMLVSG
jgi:hypothetical protein